MLIFKAIRLSLGITFFSRTSTSCPSPVSTKTITCYYGIGIMRYCLEGQLKVKCVFLLSSKSPLQSEVLSPPIFTRHPFCKHWLSVKNISLEIDKPKHPGAPLARPPLRLASAPVLAASFFRYVFQALQPLLLLVSKGCWGKSSKGCPIMSCLMLSCSFSGYPRAIPKTPPFVEWMHNFWLPRGACSHDMDATCDQ